MSQSFAGGDPQHRIPSRGCEARGHLARRTSEFDNIIRVSDATNSIESSDDVLILALGFLWLPFLWPFH